MKKTLSILSTLILTSSATIILTSNLNTHVQQTKNENKTSIDWNDVKTQTNEYFKNLKNEQKSKKISYAAKDKQISSEETIKYMQEKTIEYINKLQNQNSNLNQVIEFLSNENNNFKENYNNVLQKQTKNITQIKTINNSKTSNKNFKLLKSSSFDDVTTLVKVLRISTTTFSTLSTISAIVAAGFWAAAWFFGLSIPAALAATTISVAISLLSATTNSFLLQYDKNLSNLDKTSTTYTLFHDFGVVVAHILKPQLIASEITVSVSSWAVPAADAVIPIILTIVNLIEVFM